MNEKSVISGKLTELLKTFTCEEFKEFGLFISSPFFNKETVQEKLYGIFKKYYPAFEGRDFNKEKLFSKLYPGKKFNDGILRNMFSRTLALAENFLTICKYRNDEFNYSLNLLSELSERKQTKLFERNLIHTESYLEKETYKDSDYHYKASQFLNEQINFKGKQKSLLELDDEKIFDLSDNISVSFMINMLKIYVYILNTNRYMYHYEKYKSLMEGIENHIRDNYDKYKNITYLDYYYNAYMLAKTEDEKYYFNLFELLINMHSELRYTDKRDLYTILTNYCYLKTNKGALSFLAEQFNIYRKNVETGFYKALDGFMSHIFFINVVITGLEAGETNWVENFIDKFKPELDDVNKENTYIFCCSFYNYRIKDYSKALDLAAKVRTDDLSYKHQLKSLYLKIYYDLNETETFYSHIDSYKHFISSDNNVSEQIRLTVGNYIGYAKKLFDYKSGGNFTDVDLAMIKKDIINNKAMINKPWLLRKIEEIEKTI